MNTGGWVDVSPSFPCPRCGARRWCTVAPDRTAVKCHSDSTGKPVKDKNGDTSWYHHIDGAAAVGVNQLIERPKPPSMSPSQVEAIDRRCRADLSTHRLDAASRSLGIPAASLAAFGVGFHSARRYEGGYVGDGLSFLMVDEDRVPVGIRIRLYKPLPDGRKYFCVPGSQNGLFIPTDYVVPTRSIRRPESDPRDVLLLPEGVTCAAAAQGLGFRTVGRFNVNGGAGLIRRLIFGRPGTFTQAVVIIADSDAAKPMPNGSCFWPGWEGALHVARSILPACGTLRVLSVRRLPWPAPPTGKVDLRDWVRACGHAGLLMAAVASTPPATHRWIDKQLAEVEEMKQRRQRTVATAGGGGQAE